MTATMTRPMAKGALATWLHQNGYTHIRELPDGRWAAIMPLIFTTAIVTGTWAGAVYGYDDRWCYRTPDMARVALEAWNGQGEPIGWHRHPDTGRRVNEETGEAYVAQ